MKYNTEKAQKTASTSPGWMAQLACFASNGFISAGDMLGDSEALQELKTMGFICQTSKGWYLITAKGLDLIDEMNCIHM